MLTQFAPMKLRTHALPTFSGAVAFIHSGALHRCLTPLVGGLFALSTWATAQAQSLDGDWQAGTTTMDVQVESWGPDCGPEPQSSKSASGGVVSITEAGNEVVIHGRDRDLRTDQCWSRNPAIRRRSSRYLNGEWITQCQTPEHDPRAEIGTYTLKKLGDNELRYNDLSQYNWQLKTSTCVATMRTTQTLRRIVANPRPAAGKTSTAKSSDKAPCTPSIPTRLSVRPLRSEVELGEEVCVRATAVDALGCVVRGAAVRYSLAHAPVLKGQLVRNCFRSSENAAEGEGEFRIVATLDGLRAEAVVQVSSMDLSDLIAKRLEVGAISGFDEEEQAQLPPAGSAGVRVSADRSVQPSGGPPILSFSLAGAALLVLLFALLWVRNRKPARVMSAGPSRSSSPLPPPTLASGPEEASTAAGGTPWICPECRRGFPQSQRTCPQCVGEIALMPYGEFLEQSRKQEGQRRRCRACGAACDGVARFCGECGSQDLELID